MSRRQNHKEAKGNNDIFSETPSESRKFGGLELFSSRSSSNSSSSRLLEESDELRDERAKEKVDSEESEDENEDNDSSSEKSSSVKTESTFTCSTPKSMPSDVSEHTEPDSQEDEIHGIKVTAISVKKQRILIREAWDSVKDFFEKELPNTYSEFLEKYGLSCQHYFGSESERAFNVLCAVKKGIRDQVIKFKPLADRDAEGSPHAMSQAHVPVIELPVPFYELPLFDQYATIVHELTHIFGGTIDEEHCYVAPPVDGEDSPPLDLRTIKKGLRKRCQELARTSPEEAAGNAYNYTFFLESIYYYQKKEKKELIVSSFNLLSDYLSDEKISLLIKKTRRVAEKFGIPIEKIRNYLQKFIFLIIAVLEALKGGKTDDEKKQSDLRPTLSESQIDILNKKESEDDKEQLDQMNEALFEAELDDIFQKEITELKEQHRRSKDSIGKVVSNVTQELPKTEELVDQFLLFKKPKYPALLDQFKKGILDKTISAEKIIRFLRDYIDKREVSNSGRVALNSAKQLLRWISFYKVQMEISPLQAFIKKQEEIIHELNQHLAICR